MGRVTTFLVLSALISSMLVSNPAQVLAAPTATFSPTSGPPGTTVQITASGLVPTEPIVVFWRQKSSDGSYGVGVNRFNTNADANGNLRVSVSVPSTFAPGTYFLTFQNPNNIASSAGVDFAVTSPQPVIVPTPTAQPTSTPRPTLAPTSTPVPTAVPTQTRVQPTIAPVAISTPVPPPVSTAPVSPTASGQVLGASANPPLIVLVAGTIFPLARLAEDGGTVVNVPPGVLSSACHDIPKTSGGLRDIYGQTPFCSNDDINLIYQKYTCYNVGDRVSIFKTGLPAFVPSLQAALIRAGMYSTQELDFDYGNASGVCGGKPGMYTVEDTFGDPGKLAQQLQGELLNYFTQPGHPLPSAVYMIGHSGGGAIAASWAQQYSLGDVPTKVVTLDSPLYQCDGTLAGFICDGSQLVAPVAKPAVEYYKKSNVPLVPNLYVVGNKCDLYVNQRWAVPPDYLNHPERGVVVDQCGGDAANHTAVFRSCAAISWMLYATNLDYLTPIAGCPANPLSYLPDFLYRLNP